MRFVQHRFGLRPFLLPAAAAALALAGCGGGEEAGSTASVASAPAAAPTPSAGENQTQYKGLSEEGVVDLMEFKPFELPLEGEVEFEKGSEKPLVTSFPSEEGIGTQPTVPNLPGVDPILGSPLVINGQVVPLEAIREQICLGAMGATEVEDARLRIFIDEERKRLVSIDAQAERLELAPGELEEYLGGVEDQLKSEYPDGEIGMEDLFKGLASSDPKEKLRNQMEFSKLYMPDDPANFPPVTIEAILKQEGGQSVLDHFKQAHEARLAATEPVMKDPAELQFEGAIMQSVLAHLLETATTAFKPAPGVLYRINGIDIKTEDIWNRIKDRVTTMEVLRAKQWIVNSRLLKEAFVGSGSWLSDEEASAAYFAHSDPYLDSIFSMERIALMVKQFPSIEYYKDYHRMYESFKRMRKPSADELKEFAESRTKKIVGQVAVDVDVILCSAFDFKSNTWLENGWVQAENRMRDVVNLLVEEQRPWEELLERYSDFYEPPTPVSQRAFAEPSDSPKGRFRDVQRNGLIGRLGESDFGYFLSGTCITDFIFFGQEVNSLGQPMRGPYGWYLPRLLKRSKAPQRLPMDEDTLNELIEDDYVTTKLAEFAQALIAKSEVYGLDLPGSKEAKNAKKE